MQGPLDNDADYLALLASKDEGRKSLNLNSIHVVYFLFI